MVDPQVIGCGSTMIMVPGGRAHGTFGAKRAPAGNAPERLS